MIRPAVPADAAALAQVDASSHTPWTERQLRETLEQPSTRAWVIDGIGHVLGRQIGPEAEILQITISVAERRRGQGRRLLLHAMHWLRTHGVRSFFLEARADNVAAQALYLSAGFRPTGLRAGYYRDGSDALVMTCSGS